MITWNQFLELTIPAWWLALFISFQILNLVISLLYGWLFPKKKLKKKRITI